jgi:hypothetical protein
MTDPRGQHAATPFRLTVRTGIGAVLCALGIVGVSCQGTNCVTSPETFTVPVTTAVGSLYRLSAVGPSNLPATYADSANYQPRVFADTLALTPATLAYGESGSVSRVDTTTHAEVVGSYRLTGSHVYTIDAAGNLSFPQLLGGPGVAVPIASAPFAVLQITEGGKVWTFEPVS